MTVAKYKVKAPAVVARVDDPRRQVYLYRGATLPPAVSDEEARRLVRRGLVVEVVEVVEVAPAPAPPATDGDIDAGEGADLEGMTVDDLREYAAVSDIDLNGATRKADIIAAIRAAEQD